MIGNSKDARLKAPKLYVPGLSIRGPFLVGLAAIAVLLGGGLLWSTVHQIDRVLLLAGTVEPSGRVTAVRNELDGAIARLYVGKGDEVSAGQIIARLSNSAMDGEIAKLRANAARSRLRLQSIRAKAAGVAGASRGSKIATRRSVGALAKQIGEMEDETAALVALIAWTKRKIGLAEIRAPVAGRIGTIIAGAPGTVLAPGTQIAAIITADRRLTVRARAPLDKVDVMAPGTVARVALTDIYGRRLNGLTARLTSRKETQPGAARTPPSYQDVYFQLDASQPQIANQIALYSSLRAEIQIKTARLSLLDHIAGPLPPWLTSVSIPWRWTRSLYHEFAKP